LVSHLSGSLQDIEKEEESSHIAKREEPGGSKSQIPIERGGGNRKNRKDSQRPSHGPQNRRELDLDAISEHLRPEKSIESLDE
jgi:hypothetical protein